MGELRADTLAVFLVGATVIAVPDDCLSGVQNFFGRDREPLPDWPKILATNARINPPYKDVIYFEGSRKKGSSLLNFAANNPN